MVVLSPKYAVEVRFWNSVLAGEKGSYADIKLFGRHCDPEGTEYWRPMEYSWTYDRESLAVIRGDNRNFAFVLLSLLKERGIDV